eukprot:6210122-Pleurochrysis_carterae.AAC.3
MESPRRDRSQHSAVGIRTRARRARVRMQRVCYRCEPCGASTLTLRLSSSAVVRACTTSLQGLRHADAAQATGASMRDARAQGARAPRMRASGVASVPRRLPARSAALGQAQDPKTYERASAREARQNTTAKRTSAHTCVV